MIQGKRAARLDIGPACFSGLNSGRDGRNAAVRHGLTLGQTILVRIILLSAVTVLFGGIVEETTTALKIGRIVGGAARVAVDAKKRLGHGQLIHERIGDGLAVGKRATALIHIARQLGDVLGCCTPGIKGLIESAKRRLCIDGGSVAAGRIKGTACGEYHSRGRHGSRNRWRTGDVVLTDFHPWTKLLG
jgi:hypothetical protein